ncbi:transporter substrate-binding domain-containing protein [Nonomuraea sp. NPDC046802]|uniref:transporter substrate-binding domain-containing protein n=1 Tax=Nonomuraea sp. NPDC046802 TaxID=3154919 RepID=UPI0033FFAC58
MSMPQSPPGRRRLSDGSAEILYYEKYSDVLLGLKSGRVQAYFGPNPTIAYNIAVSGGSRIVGTFSGAGPDLQGLIAAMTKKDNGLVEPLNEAIARVDASAPPRRGARPPRRT